MTPQEPADETGSAAPTSVPLPDLSDLISSKPRRTAGGGWNLRQKLMGVAVVVGLVLLVGGFFAGRATASKTSGPATLADAFRLAQQGKLPCGSSAGATGPGNFIARLCGGGNGFGNGLGNGFGGGGRFIPGQGGAGRFGIPGTITSVTNGKLTVQTRAGNVTFDLPSDVAINKTVTGTLRDLKNGATVQVTSTTGNNGTRIASQVVILPPGTAGGTGA